MILINPSPPNRMGMIERYSPRSIPLGIATLAGCLMAKGKGVKIIDELVNPFEVNTNSVKSWAEGFEGPLIFGISCLTVNIKRCYAIAREIKRTFPDAWVVFGGIHPTALPEEPLSTGVVDIVVRGEAESIIVDLYDVLKQQGYFENIPGISYIKGGKITHNPCMKLINDLDEIPSIPYELFNSDKYYRGYILSSRGCPHNCIICSQRLISGNRYRYNSFERVIEEIDFLVNQLNQKKIFFLDDDFLINKKRVRTLCGAIREREYAPDVEFGCQARADSVTEEILNHLKESGFTSIGLGIESASEKLLKILDKRETVQQNIEAVKMIKKKGLGIAGCFIFGLPSETWKDRFDTYWLAKTLKLDNAKFNNAVPYPGTKLYDIARDEGALFIDEDWGNFNSVGGVVGGLFSDTRLPYIPQGTTESRLRKDMVRANLYFYLSHLYSLFGPKRGSLSWFVPPPKWYLKPRELTNIGKLGLSVLVNCVLVFSPRWFLKGLFNNVRSFFLRA
jgi:anaerobic magnesium-protoporphyrin IX monomethyl ester cyclase